MTGAVIAELARVVVAAVACLITVVVLLVAAAVFIAAWPEGWSRPNRRYRGRRRAGGRVWLPW